MFENLPGGEIITKGLRDISLGENSEDALLLFIGESRLSIHGIRIPKTTASKEFAEHQLYDLLFAKYGAEAYQRYNALIQDLVSLENALDVKSS